MSEGQTITAEQMRRGVFDAQGRLTQRGMDQLFAEPELLKVDLLKQFHQQLVWPPGVPKRPVDPAVEPGDVVNDAYVRTSTHFENAGPDKEFYLSDSGAWGYARTTLQNEALNHIRRNSRAPLSNIDIGDGDATIFGPHIASFVYEEQTQLRDQLIDLSIDISQNPLLPAAIDALYSDEAMMPIYPADYNYDSHQIALSPQALVFCNIYIQLRTLAETDPNVGPNTILAFLHNASNIETKHT